MKVRGLAGYAALGLPLAMAMLPIYMISPKFYGDALGVNLAALGAVLFLARLLDTIQDPFIGRLVDFLQHKKAGWPVLMSLGAVVLALGFVMLFDPPRWSETGLLAWLAVSLVVVYSAHSVINVCYLTWGARLTDDVDGRSRVTAWREAFGLVGVVVASMLPAFWVADEGARQGYRQFAWVFVGVLGVGLSWTLWQSPKPRIVGGQIREGWRHVLAPAAVRRVLWFYFFNAVSVAIPATLVLFYIDDVLQMPGRAGLFLGLYFLSGMLTLPLWVALADRLGKAQAWLGGTCLAILAFALVPLVGQGNGVLFGVVCLVSGAALGADLALPPAMLADVIPPAQRPRTGLYFGIWALIAKLALALAAGMSLPLLTVLDYQPGQPATAWALTSLYVVLPLLFKALAIVALFPRRGPALPPRATSRTESSS